MSVKDVIIFRILDSILKLCGKSTVYNLLRIDTDPDRHARVPVRIRVHNTGFKSGTNILSKIKFLGGYSYTVSAKSFPKHVKPNVKENFQPIHYKFNAATLKRL
jgi:hypothetical protein